MQNEERENLEAIWQLLSTRYDWQLVRDEEAFRVRIIFWYLQPHIQGAKAAIRCAYNELIYAGFQQRSEQAALELWNYLRQNSLKSYSSYEAEELAQATITEVIERLDEVRHPEFFTTFAWHQLRTVVRRMTRREQRELSWPNNPAGVPVDLPAPQNLLETIEQDTLLQEFQAIVAQALPIERDRSIILLSAIEELPPREIARALKLDPNPSNTAKIRVAKNRALNNLKNNPDFLDFLNRIRDKE